MKIEDFQDTENPMDFRVNSLGENCLATKICLEIDSIKKDKVAFTLKTDEHGKTF